MTRKFKLATVTAATTSAGVAGVLIAGGLAPLPASAQDAAPHHVRVTMSVHPSADHQVDLAPTGMSVGDEIFEHGTLNRAGHHYGSYAFTGTLVRLPGKKTPPRETQHFTLHLPGGAVEASGEHQAVDSFTLAVLGGTGRWAQARGTLKLTHGKATLNVNR